METWITVNIKLFYIALSFYLSFSTPFAQVTANFDVYVTTYKGTKGVYQDSATALAEMSNMSKMRCVSLCSETVECVAINYFSKQGRRCQLLGSTSKTEILVEDLLAWYSGKYAQLFLCLKMAR